MGSGHYLGVKRWPNSPCVSLAGRLHKRRPINRYFTSAKDMVQLFFVQGWLRIPDGCGSLCTYGVSGSPDTGVVRHE